MTCGVCFEYYGTVQEVSSHGHVEEVGVIPGVLEGFEVGPGVDCGEDFGRLIQGGIDVRIYGVFGRFGYDV